MHAYARLPSDALHLYCLLLWGNDGSNSLSLGGRERAAGVDSINDHQLGTSIQAVRTKLACHRMRLQEDAEVTALLQENRNNMDKQDEAV